jgi:hypothetical protein
VARTRCLWSGRTIRGEGRRAVVVGCGLGADAEYTAGENIAGLVAAEGTLLVLAAAYDPNVPESPVPPWPLRQNEIDASATDGLIPVRVVLLPAPRSTLREGLAGRVPSASSQQRMTSAARSMTAISNS